MKGGPRAATALPRRRLDTVHAGPGSRRGWEHPGGWSTSCRAGGILGGLEHPWGWGDAGQGVPGRGEQDRHRPTH